jgi:hypothetical protein
MDASQLWYLEIVHSGSNRSFVSFYAPKFSEMLRNTPKHHSRSNGVEWMLHNIGTKKWCIKLRNTSFASFYEPRVSEMLRNTPKHHSRSNGVEWMLHNIGTRKWCIQARNTSFASFTSQGLAKWSEATPNIILGPID